MADGDIPGVDELDPEFQAKQEQDEKTEAERRSDSLRAYAERRMHAYLRVFIAGTPDKEDREIVMADLLHFTRGESTPWHDDPRMHCVMTGRHEVWTRIKDHTKLTLDEFITKYQTGDTKEK